ncbi:unnamed protein product [Schistosoma mattheei]|uniref:Uncharacterized protein n=1 Tax=Schistosoma mattheei TaxID=31246 RepID=A0A183PHJ4_9TREM|nr:unnamed protein product [Schistosoma mattheei]
MLLYCDHEKENALHTQGVALMSSKDGLKALTGSYGSKVIKASSKTKKEGIVTNVVQCYAPTSDNTEQYEDQFYEGLQSIVEKCSRKDLTILMGGLNFDVRIENTRYEDITGRHELGEGDENDGIFSDLSAFKKMVIGGTTHHNKHIH